jgi:hypothetical protein
VFVDSALFEETVVLGARRAGAGGAFDKGVSTLGTPTLCCLEKGQRASPEEATDEAHRELSKRGGNRETYGDPSATPG